MKRIAASFINVDLDVKATVDLSPLAKAWTDQVMPLHVGKNGRRHWVRFELTGPVCDPGDAILRFCRLIQRLPRAGRVAWRNASFKEFDIGIQAGLESRTSEWLLRPTVVAAVRNVGAHIRVTVYSPLPLLEAENQRLWRLTTTSGLYESFVNGTMAHAIDRD